MFTGAFQHQGRTQKLIKCIYEKTLITDIQTHSAKVKVIKVKDTKTSQR